MGSSAVTPGHRDAEGDLHPGLKEDIIVGGVDNAAGVSSVHSPGCPPRPQHFAAKSFAMAAPIAGGRASKV